MNTQVKDANLDRRETVLPPSDTTPVHQIDQFLSRHGSVAYLMARDGSKTPLPDEVFDVLVLVVQAMANGAAVTVVPDSMRLTTSRAAEMLGISRPTLVRLLEDGEIPYEQPRRHRLLRLEDVLAFKERRKAERKAKLAEMTRQAVADGLYDQTYDDYADALKQARRGQA